jgi:hypothetical protein
VDFVGIAADKKASEVERFIEKRECRADTALAFDEDWKVKDAFRKVMKVRREQQPVAVVVVVVVVALALAELNVDSFQLDRFFLLLKRSRCLAFRLLANILQSLVVNLLAFTVNQLLDFL